MGSLSDASGAFGAASRELKELLDKPLLFDLKTDEFLHSAQSINARSALCVYRHVEGAKAAGATSAEISSVFALMLREVAGADSISSCCGGYS